MSDPNAPSLFLEDSDSDLLSDGQDASEEEDDSNFEANADHPDHAQSASRSSEDLTNTGLWGSSSSSSSSSDPGVSSPQHSTGSHAPSHLFPLFVQGPLRILIQRVIHERMNVVVTGPAGSGKTSMLVDLMARLKARRRDKVDTIYALAPTHAAAATIGGSTVHSWSGIDFGLDSSDDRAESVYIKRAVKQRWRAATALFIDEGQWPM
ncbi:hypothetical protein CF326_g4376 [Tilletia indica]|nr:hypothetical protein CF326_g4376 [Tilletia indica]